MSIEDHQQRWRGSDAVWHAACGRRYCLFMWPYVVAPARPCPMDYMDELGQRNSLAWLVKSADGSTCRDRSVAWWKGCEENDATYKAGGTIKHSMNVPCTWQHAAMAGVGFQEARWKHHQDPQFSLQAWQGQAPCFYVAIFAGMPEHQRQFALMRRGVANFKPQGSHSPQTRPSGSPGRMSPSRPTSPSEVQQQIRRQLVNDNLSACIVSKMVKTPLKLFDYHDVSSMPAQTDTCPHISYVVFPCRSSVLATSPESWKYNVLTLC